MNDNERTDDDSRRLSFQFAFNIQKPLRCFDFIRFLHQSKSVNSVTI